MGRGMFAAGMGIVAMATTSASMAAAPKPDQVRAAVQSVLSTSAAGWNRLDLDLFMTSYEDAATTTYVSNGQVNQGFQAIRAIYAKRFAGGGATMGQLTLDIVDLRLVGPDHAYVIGRFTLRRAAADGGDATGITTLLFRHTPKGWRIVADHS